MNVTLLGTGDATSVPAPLCDCEYCVASNRRRHPAVLVETTETTLLFDVGPDIQEQLDAVDVREVDGAFLTHAHGDHSAGLPTIGQTAKWDGAHLDRVDELEPTGDAFDPGYSVYLTETARAALAKRYGFLDSRLTFESVDDGQTVSVGDCEVTAVPVEHHRPEAQTLGFVVETDGSTVCYAPDMRRWYENPPTADVDLLVCEGAAVLGQPVHGPTDELLAAIDAVDADRVVLVNVNEHLQRKHTGELAAVAADHGCELGVDFETYEV